MKARMAMDGNYQVVVGGVNNNGQFAQNVFHFAVAGSSGADEYNTAFDLCSSFLTTTVPLLQGVMSGDSTINILYAKRLSAGGEASIFHTILVNGTFAGSAMSNVVSCNIAFYPGGTKNRPGHLFTWGVSTNGVQEDVIQPGLLTALQALGGGLLTPLTIASGGTGTYGTYTKSTKNITPAVHYNVKPKVTGLNKRTLPLY
jgi:hypothetical protein